MYIRTTWAHADILEIASVLESGHIVVGTSDTVLGLLATTTEQGFDALNRIKGRSEKPYLVLAHNMEKALALTTLAHDQTLVDCLRACWPGPLTVILPANATVPTCLQSKEQAIAVRVPNHQGLQKLLTQIPYLFSTSANRTSQPVPHHVAAIDQSILDQCAYLITEHTVDTASTMPSTIIDCTQRPCTIIREGAIPVAILRTQYPNLFQEQNVDELP